MKPKPGISRKAISEALANLAAQAQDTTPDGDVLTKADKLAALLWDRALGWTDSGGKYREPEQWAIQVVLERLEGKAPTAVADEEERLSPTARVREIAKDRANRIAEKAAKIPPPPPSFEKDEE